MIDSLVGLIAAVAVAALPILVTILRFRRRRRAKRGKRGAEDTTADTGAPQPRPKTRTSPQVRPAGGTKKADAETPPVQSETITAPREAAYVSSNVRSQRFPETLNRYPPLQRAILLQEILGPPKGLQSDRVFRQS